MLTYREKEFPCPKGFARKDGNPEPAIEDSIANS
jgi:hypothetical protein